MQWQTDISHKELMHKKKSNKYCDLHKDEINDSNDEEEKKAEEDGAKGKCKKM